MRGLQPALLLHCLRQYLHKEVYDYDHSLIFIEKKLQAGKPDSVVGYHLSVLNITVGINLPTLYRVALRQTSGEQPLTIVYVAFQHARFTRE